MKYISHIFKIILCIPFLFSSVNATTVENEEIPLIEPVVAIGFGDEMNCSELLGNNLTEVIYLVILLLRIGAVIYTIVSGMLSMMPAITSSDQDKLKECISKFIKMLIVCVVIVLLPTIVSIIGKIFNYDLSCFV